jgi:hypothetical protein
MAHQRLLVTDFSRGITSERMIPRIDQSKSVAELTGFVVLPDGGVKRREGTLYGREGLGITPSEEGTPAFTVLEKRIAGTETLHFLWINDTPAAVVQNVVNRTTQTVSNSALENGQPLWDSGKFNNSLESLYEQNLHFWTPGASHVLDLEDWTLAQKTSQEISTIYQARLIAVDRTWGTVFMSIPYIYLDFDSDGYLELMPDFYGFETPAWVKALGGAVYIGTDKSEWLLTSSYPYFTDDLGGLMMKRISGIGTDLAVVFASSLVMAKDRRLMRIAYSGESAFQSQSLAEMIDNADAIQVDSMEYGSHRYLFFVDRDKKLWCYTECVSSGVAAWSVLAEDVGWAKVFNQDLYVAREGASSWDVQVIPMDNLNFPGNRSQALKDAFFDRTVYADQGGFVKADYDSVEGYTVESDYLKPSATLQVYLLDGTFVGERTTTAAGTLSGTNEEIATFLGYTDSPVYAYCYPETAIFTSTLKTLPIELGTAYGSGLGTLRRINKVVVRVYKSKALRVRANNGKWSSWSSETEFTGNVELPVDCGHDDLVQLEIQSVGVLPLHIHSIQIDATMGDE